MPFGPLIVGVKKFNEVSPSGNGTPFGAVHNGGSSPSTSTISAEFDSLMTDHFGVVAQLD